MSCGTTKTWKTCLLIFLILSVLINGLNLSFSYRYLLRIPISLCKCRTYKIISIWPNFWWSFSGNVQVSCKIKCQLTHFKVMFHFYTPWKCQKTIGFLTFSGSIESKHCFEMSKIYFVPVFLLVWMQQLQ